MLDLGLKFIYLYLVLALVLLVWLEVEIRLKVLLILLILRMRRLWIAALRRRASHLMDLVCWMALHLLAIRRTRILAVQLLGVVIVTFHRHLGTLVRVVTSLAILLWRSKLLWLLIQVHMVAVRRAGEVVRVCRNWVGVLD